MPINTTTMRNALATTYGSTGPYLGLLSALTLQTAASAGAITVSVDLSVAIGDTLYFDYGQGTAESRVVTGVSGAGPYTVSHSALTFAHSSGALVSHIPIATIHEMSGGSYARVAATWGAASNSAITSAAAAVNVPAGGKVGAVAVFSAITAGNYLDSNPVAGQSFSSAGTYTPVYTETLS